MKKERIVFTAITICTILLICAVVAPYLLTRSITTIDFSDKGQIGDTIAGTTAPFIGITTAILTFLAFYIQYEANNRQQQDIKRQEDELKRQESQRSIEAFESTLFKMLDLHQSSVNHLVIETTSDNNEFRGNYFLIDVLETVDSLFAEYKKSFPDLNDEKVLGLAYLYMYYGNDLLENTSLRNKFNDFLPSNEDLSRLQGIELSETRNFSITNHGYGVFLSRYFRQIYQIYKSISVAAERFKDTEEFSEMNYARIVRSTLTHTDQVLLFYNCITPLGKAWIDESLILKYKVIKNISIPLVKTLSPVTWMRHHLEDKDPDFSEYVKQYFEFYEDMEQERT